MVAKMKKGLFDEVLYHSFYTLIVELGRRVLRRVIASKDGNFFKDCPTELRLELMKLNPNQIHELASEAKVFMKLEIDYEALAMMLFALKKDANDDSLVIYFVKKGADSEMMKDFFGYGRHELAGLRATYQVDVHGKPKELNDKEQTLLLEFWKNHEDKPLMQRYVALTLMTNIRLKDAYHFFKKNSIEQQ